MHQHNQSWRWSQAIYSRPTRFWHGQSSSASEHDLYEINMESYLGSNATSSYDRPSDRHSSVGQTQISTSVPPLFDPRSFRPWSLSCLPITIPNVYNIKIIHWLKWNYSTILFLCPDKKYLCTNKDIVRIQGYVRNFPMKTLHSQKLQATNDFGIKYWKFDHI